MLFTSYEFIAFAAILLLLYYILPKAAQKYVLFCGNMIFYAVTGWQNLIFLFVTICTTFGAALWVDKNLKAQKEQLALHKADWDREQKKAYRSGEKTKRKMAVAIAAIVNVGFLAFVKFPHTQFRFLMPMGISFYTLMSLGYLFDVYRETQEAEKNLFRYALFVSYFPQLVQGPISRFNELSETLFKEHDFEGKNITFGLYRILWGFFKKLVIADRLAVAVGTISGDFETYHGSYIFLEMFLYTIQLYADFSGGIDVTIGLSEMFGIHVTENFIRPYFSKSLKEYWRRWHITMSTWFRDYLFYPISITPWMQNLSKFLRKKCGERIGKRLPVYLASFIVWAVTGIWHGTTSNFIVWGIINWFILMVSEELEPLYEKFHARFIPASRRGWQAFMVLRTFTMLCFLKLFDCYATAGEVFRAFGSAFSEPNPGEVGANLFSLGLTPWDYLVAGCGALLMLVVSLLQRRESVRLQLSKKSFALRVAVGMGLFLVTLIFGAYGVGYDASQFIYNRF